MSLRSQKSVQIFKEGYNCAQSVLGAFCDEIGMEFEDTMKLASSFGGGMGRMREVCGAVSALFMIAGMKYGYTTPNDDITKEKHYALIQKLADKFKQKYGTIICRELLNTEDKSPKPSSRTEEYYASRPCEEFIKTSTEIADELLQSNLGTD